jgi:hypothetical protein
MEALKRYRSGGEQKMTVQHVHVAKGGQAIVGKRNNPMLLDMRQALRCHAKSKRSAFECQSPAVRGYRVCRMHGAGDGAPQATGTPSSMASTAPRPSR